MWDICDAGEDKTRSLVQGWFNGGCSDELSS